MAPESAPCAALDRVISVLFCGVGGQGTILAGDLLAKVAANAGCDVTLSEVHGMSQRGGSVDTLIRFGPEVHSPLICLGEADVVVAFEELEGARWAPYLREGGTIVLALTRIAPLPVLLGKVRYPDGLVDDLSSKAQVVAVDAAGEAAQAGGARAANLVMLGALSTLLPFLAGDWEDVIRLRVPPKTVETNVRAFARGRAIAAEGR
jgi:indolepyruvate ferredoxin oxidoreductase beta subunit